MTIISLLRGVNVGAHHRIRMEDLRAIYESLGLTGLRTYVQSGNILFKTKERNLVKLAARIDDAIEARHKFRPAVILRTTADLRQVVALNPFARRDGTEPGKLLVNFLAEHPADAARQSAEKISVSPEEMHLSGREMYIYFPNGMGRSKFPWAQIDKALKLRGTGRNWNTVTRLLEMAEEMEK